MCFFLFSITASKDTQENQDRDKFIEKSTVDTIQKIIREESVDDPGGVVGEVAKGLGE